MWSAGLVQVNGFGSAFVLGDVAVDRRLQVDERVEAAAADAAPGQGREEGFDRVQPRARGRREVKHPARMTAEPFEHLGVLVAA